MICLCVDGHDVNGVESISLRLYIRTERYAAQCAF